MAENAQADQIVVRELLARELETINHYHGLMARAESDGVRDFIQHVIDEEVEHIAEAFAVLRQVDPAQAAVLDTGGHMGLSTAPPPTPSPVVAEPPPRQEVFPRQQFTVGSLRGVPQS